MRCATTHATGSMLWKKGATEDIDQRHFFRDEVFADIDWGTDRVLPATLERIRGWGSSVALLPERRDIDVAEDLDAVDWKP